MRKLLVLFLTSFLAAHLPAQTDSRKNTAYAEILGNGVGLSANYELQLNEIRGVGIHLGIGLGGYGPNIPFGIKYLLDLGKERFFLETGLGITLGEKGVWDLEHQNEPGALKYKPALIPSAGFRYHARSGYMCRLNYTPVFTKWDDTPWLFGVSLGWRF